MQKTEQNQQHSKRCILIVFPIFCRGDCPVGRVLQNTSDQELGVADVFLEMVEYLLVLGPLLLS